MSTNKNTIDRREFIEISTKGAAALGLVSLPMLNSCAADVVKTVKGACYHDCPDRCSWHVTTVNNKVTEFKASQDNPFTAGKLCDKMVNFPQDVTYHPDRILTPLKRIGPKGEAQFEKISWEQAIQEVSDKLKAVIDKKGGEAILPYSFGGNQGMVQGDGISKRFFARAGASRLERTICGDPAVEGVLATNGQTTGVLTEDIVHSRFIILWGTNPVQSNQHLWPFIEKARSNGAKIVVIDPFVSQTAEKANWHIQPNPGTDTALALGLIHVILREGLQDQDYIDRYTSGIDELTAHVKNYAPQTVAEITGLEEDVIVELAKAYAAGDPSLIRVLIGMEHQANGSSAFRTIAMLPSITGAWRHFGGGLMHFTYELAGKALNWNSFTLPESLANQKTRAINMIQLGKALTDRQLTPSIDALFVYNSNPAVTTPNQNLVLEGLKREDLMTVVIEHFMTDTARYADYIFPATSVLENWDILDSWGTTYVNINEPAIAPLGEAKPNTEFFRLLSKAMGYTEPYLYETDLEMVKNTLDTKHEYMKGVTFESLRKTGWAKYQVPEKWMPHLEGNFGTASGKCLFYNPDIDPPLPHYVPVAIDQESLAKYPLQLMSIKTPKNFLNSSHANVDYLIQKEGKPYLEISEEDSIARNITDGDEVKVVNQRGRVFLTARIGKKVKAGTVCMPQGFWPSRMKGGSSANALTDDLLTDMGRGGAIQEARVEVIKA